MGRACVGLLLAFVLGSTPVLVGICQARCAAHDEQAQSNSGSDHHSCHDESPVSGTALNAAPHVCDHADQLPVSFDQSLQTIAAPSSALTASSFSPPAVSLLHRHPAHAVRSPSNLLTLTSQLRV